jgi:hypothetical protein
MAKSAVEKYTPGPRYALIKASFNLETAKKNYQRLLQHLAATKVTKDNVNEDHSEEGRQVLKLLATLKDEASKEPLQWHKDIMAAYRELTDPLDAEVKRLSEEKKAISIVMQREAAQQLAEQVRINNAKQAIIDFTNKVATMIGLAKTDTDIVSIEKLIGSEGRKSTVYFEFLPDLIQRCETLKPDIKAQKETIRELQRIENEKKEAESSGNIIALTELKAKEESVTELLQDRAIRIHEQAYDQASTIDVVAPEIAENIPKGRTNWKWRVDDIKLLQKKMPHLVKVVPDEEAISQLLATKRLDGSLKDKLEENWNGIVFYNDKSFK